METKIETLAEFHERTGFFTQHSLPDHGELCLNPNLSKKVDETGDFLPYYGNTVVFCLPESAKERIRALQAALYTASGSILARQLDPATFHITLHDLANGPSPALMEQEVPQIQQHALDLVGALQAEVGAIRLHSSCLFNMVNTSMVLGFVPSDEESCHRLMTFYQRLQEVLRLDYPLTPHVTVAYFRPGRICTEDVAKLNKVIAHWKCEPALTLELCGADLAYQLFSSMNHYWTP